MKVGVIVGRFQVPMLHEGHYRLIEHAMNNYDRVIIFIGDTISKKLTLHDPLPYEARKSMIAEVWPNAIIGKIVDVGNWEKWVKNLDTLIECACIFEHIENPEIYICGSRDSVVDRYKESGGKYEIDVFKEFVGFQGTRFSGTDERRKILETYKPCWNIDQRNLAIWINSWNNDNDDNDNSSRV